MLRRGLLDSAQRISPRSKSATVDRVPRRLPHTWHVASIRNLRRALEHEDYPLQKPTPHSGCDGPEHFQPVEEQGPKLRPQIELPAELRLNGLPQPSIGLSSPQPSVLARGSQAQVIFCLFQPTRQERDPTSPPAREPRRRRSELAPASRRPHSANKRGRGTVPA